MVTFKDGVMTEVANSSIANQKIITETRVENGEMIKVDTSIKVKVGHFNQISP